MRKLIALLIAMLGCGAASSVVTDAAVEVGSEATHDALPDAPLGVCPPAPPVAGAPCTPRVDLICEYGDALSPSCNALFVCGPHQCSGGPMTWRQLEPTKTCPTSLPNCPASYAGAADGGACSVSAQCNFVEGWCECNGVWQCESAPTNCTSNRPRLGTTCSPDTPDPFHNVCPFQLDYGACAGYVCVDGVVLPSGCAAPLPPC